MPPTTTAAVTISSLFVATGRRLSREFRPALPLAIDSVPLLGLFFLFSVAYLALAMTLPVTIYTTNRHDDALFWRNAYQIAEGNWLGPYSQMTLAKGPGFPLFLAINALSGIPVTLLIALFYLFACGLIAKRLLELGVNRYFVFPIFVVILFHPEVFPTRIIRDNIYPALSLIIIAGMIRLVFAPVQHHRRLVSAALYGLVFGFFWVTREEGIWIVPGLVFLVLVKVLQVKRHNLPCGDVLWRTAFFSLSAALFVSLIALINSHYYGKFEVVDFNGNAFSRAIKSLNSVDVGADLPYLPVSFAKRQEIYRLSPTFLQLKDFFEGKGKGWTKYYCAKYPWTCGDYAGGWFYWALRDAVASKGHYESPQRAAEFYNNITKEIATARDSGRIKCRENSIPLMPNVSMAQLLELPQKTVAAAKVAMVLPPVPADGGPSLGPLDQLQNIRQFLGNPLTTPATSEQGVRLRGWFYATNNDWLVLTCSHNGEISTWGVKRMSSPDVAAQFNNPKADSQRFSFNAPSADDCSLSTDSLLTNNFPLNELLEKPKTGFPVGEQGTLYIEEISDADTQPAQDVSVKIKTDVLAQVYKLLVPALALLGAFSYFFYGTFILMRKAPVTDFFMISTMLWCLSFCRIFVLIFVDISSFPAINSLYMSAAYPILCLASFLSMQLPSGHTMKFCNKRC